MTVVTMTRITTNDEAAMIDIVLSCNDFVEELMLEAITTIEVDSELLVGLIFTVTVELLKDSGWSIQKETLIP